jgi:hypothetical protein
LCAQEKNCYFTYFDSFGKFLWLRNEPNLRLLFMKKHTIKLYTTNIQSALYLMQNPVIGPDHEKIVPASYTKAHFITLRVQNFKLNCIYIYNML